MYIYIGVVWVHKSRFEESSYPVQSKTRLDFRPEVTAENSVTLGAALGIRKKIYIYIIILNLLVCLSF